MSKSFNELFNDFFKRNNIKPEDELGDRTKEEAKKMIDMLTNFQQVQNIDEDVEKQIDNSLGKPDKIEFYNEGDIFFEKRIWYTPNGDLVKLIVSDDPTLIKTPKIEMSLQQQLDIAVESENYEKAAAIRDKIKKIKKEQKKAK